MQKSFSTQTNLFVSSEYLSHSVLHTLDDTKALLGWSKIKALLSPIYDPNTGPP